MRGVTRSHKETLEEGLKHSPPLGTHCGDVTQHDGLHFPKKYCEKHNTVCCFGLENNLIIRILTTTFTQFIELSYEFTM